MAKATTRRSAAAVWVTRAIGLYVLAGAVLKLLWGTQDDLPGLLRRMPVDQEVLFRVVVAAELAIGLLALAKPRWSWLLVIALLVIFDITLVVQVLQGAASCGCFGARLPVPPALMLGIDTLLLLVLLLVRPWAVAGRDGAGGPAAALVIVLAALLPWWVDRGVSDPSQIRPGGLPQLVSLDVRSWPQKRVADTELAPWVDWATLPSDALWIVYANSCEVCRDLLSYLASMERGQRDLVLLRLPEDADVPVKVHDKPGRPGDLWVHTVDLDPRVQWPFTPPGAALSKDGRFVWAEEAVDLERFQELDRSE